MDDETAQQIGAQLGLAAMVVRTYYQALRTTGFNRREALHLTQAWIAAPGGNIEISLPSPAPEMFLNGRN